VAVDNEIREDDLFDRKLFKILSLLRAHRALVDIPPTLLLADKRMDTVSEFANKHGLPLMIRMDYANLSERKAQGGIPIHSLAVIEKVIDFLFGAQYYPLLHPHLDRFKDLYSAGVMLNSTSKHGYFEIVGQGFDAADLRLGKAIPHESFECELTLGNIRNRRFISREMYDREKIERKKRTAQYQHYIEYANKYGRLKANLDTFDTSQGTKRREEPDMPDEYRPLSTNYMQQLIQIASRVRYMVLDGLPPSESHIASFSMLPGRGWILWDIYGQWYKR